MSGWLKRGDVCTQCRTGTLKLKFERPRRPPAAWLSCGSCDWVEIKRRSPNDARHTHQTTTSNTGET